MAEKSVLIIDDDQTLVGALKEGLESLGFAVGTAFDGLQGILQAHQEKPDAIMLDFNMPAGGGAGVYERLRSSADTGKIPIIFLTGATVEEVKGHIRTTPNTYFLKKPVSVAQMRKVLDKIIGASKPAPAAGGPPPAPLPTTASAPETLEKEKYAGLTLPGAPPPPRLGASGTAREEENGAPPPTGTPGPSGPAPGTAGSGMGLPPTGTPGPSGPAPGTAGSGMGLPPAAKSVGGGGKTSVFDFRVAYADTDRLGIIYYGNYFRYLEQGRTELLRAAGVALHDLELQRRIFLPAVESRCEYLAPSRYDDMLRIATWVAWLGPASVCFQSDIAPADAPQKLVARGFTRHAVVGELWKPVRLPKDLQAALLPYLKKDR